MKTVAFAIAGLVLGAGGQQIAPGAVVAFTADCVTETTLTLPDGGVRRQRTALPLARNEAGQLRYELPIPGAPANKRETVIVIKDPVAQQVYEIFPATKQMVRYAVYTSAVTPSFPINFPVAPQANGYSAGRPRDLGQRNIAGIPAQGETSSMVRSYADKRATPPVTTETWRTPDGMIVEQTRQDPILGDTTVRLENVKLGQPPPELFALPADYTRTDAGAEIGAVTADLAAARAAAQALPPKPPPAPWWRSLKLKTDSAETLQLSLK